MTNSDKIKEILAKIEAYQWPEDEEPTIDAVSLHQAEKALKDLITEARIDELEQLQAQEMQLFKNPAVKRRIAELKVKESEEYDMI